ncbi:hypothetical protein ACYOEI_00540 [Singulisphaera rosea]
MKISELQQYLNDLARLLQAADGKKSATELSKVAEGLQPFRDHDLVQFAGFLARAEEYSRTGVIPVVEPKAGARAKSPAKPKLDLATLRAEVVDLHGRAPSPDVTFDLIEALRAKLDPLTKTDLTSIVDAIGLVGMKNKAKPEIINTIVNRIRSIKQSSMRTSVIDRPGATG